LSHEDQRSTTRHDLQVTVTLESDHNFFVGFTENLSEGGLFVATTARCPIGSRVEVSLSLPGTEAEPLKLAGVVRWVRQTADGSDHPAGIGLRFDKLSTEALQAIEAFTRSREPIFYDD
jgi:uncharacterized protein (TIGR02266 family)